MSARPNATRRAQRDQFDDSDAVRGNDDDNVYSTRGAPKVNGKSQIGRMLAAGAIGAGCTFLASQAYNRGGDVAQRERRQVELTQTAAVTYFNGISGMCPWGRGRGVLEACKRLGYKKKREGDAPTIRDVNGKSVCHGESSNIQWVYSKDRVNYVPSDVDGVCKSVGLKGAVLSGENYADAFDTAVACGGKDSSAWASLRLDNTNNQFPVLALSVNDKEEALFHVDDPDVKKPLLCQQ
ncbi:hypothetical protein DFS34DRAFT_682225 [Phlyctochytrium arcticum]|nr:hypothetical protein DFS34DRAFT_682225 [Phlyctochytrium arcticum]